MLDKIMECLICTILGMFLGYYVLGKEQNVTIEEHEDCIIKPSFYSKTPKEGLKEALDYYDIQHKDIVYAQAVLETGHFNSNVCVVNNNLFGLYNSEKNEYYKFNHWTESVEAYKKWIQYKYDSLENYYDFLHRITYAEDSAYIKKLKIINKQ